MISSRTIVLRVVGVLSSFLAVSPESLAAPGGESADPVVLSVGETKFTASRVAKFLEAMPPQFRTFYSESGKSKLPELLINTELLVREAKKRQLESRPEVQLQISIATDSILSNAAKLELQKEMKVTDTELQKYLDDHKSQFEEARARRIVIRSKTSVPWDQSRSPDQLPEDSAARALADDLRKKLAQGADFEELAAKYSGDSLSSGKGGDLGFNRRGSRTHMIVPPLEEKIFSMEPGTISEVMQTALGYEIVKLEQKRVPKVGDIRKELEQIVLTQKSEDALKELKSRETIQVDEKFFRKGQASTKSAK